MIKNKVINGYLVELEDSEEYLDCWIMKDGFGSSLGFLNDTGTLMHDTIGEDLTVSPYTIKLINDWVNKMELLK